ncbi:hypothetical protein BB561_002139 [Smittium simulii]|uniref:Protein BCP1 n=1 Tax=Smittium simulii TaxID=133385 RepID=A0A2T9YRS4_9FUNG|nr:hypothetical protein BB561_002139 [Smittium simulii]
MAKRRHEEVVKASNNPKQNSDDSEMDSDDNEMDIVNVDFDFFDFKQVDFHAVKRLLIQTFGEDHELFELSELTELIIKQNLVGTTVKVTGEDDPYAFLTVLNITELAETAVFKQISKYLLDKSSKNMKANMKLKEILSPNVSQDVGFIINERLTNMPAQVVPPMLKMLFEEIQWAIDDKERYNFEWYIMLSPIYREIAPTSEQLQHEEILPNQLQKDNSSKKPRTSEKAFYFHPEEEFIEPFAEYMFDFRFSKYKRAADSRNSFTDFGLLPLRRCFIIHKSQMLPIYNKLESLFKP